MALVYRGQTAQESTTVSTIETNIKARFLGHSFNVRKSENAVQRRTYPLQFRGNTY